MSPSPSPSQSQVQVQVTNMSLKRIAGAGEFKSKACFCQCPAREGASDANRYRKPTSILKWSSNRPGCCCHCQNPFNQSFSSIQCAVRSMSPSPSMMYLCQVKSLSLSLSLSMSLSMSHVTCHCRMYEMISDYIYRLSSIVYSLLSHGP